MVPPGPPLKSPMPESVTDLYITVGKARSLQLARKEAGYSSTLSLSTVVLNSRDRHGSRFPAKKIRTESRLANQPR